MDTVEIHNIDVTEENVTVKVASSHVGPPSCLPPPLPAEILSTDLAIKVQEEQAFTNTKEDNLEGGDESTNIYPTKTILNGDIHENSYPMTNGVNNFNSSEVVDYVDR